MTLTQDRKQEIVTQYGDNPQDTGNTRVQIALLTARINELTAQGATLYGVSCDASYAQHAFREKLGVSIRQLSDFEPKGAATKAFGAYFEPGGMATRALVVVDAEGVVRWSWEGEHPGVLPGANLVFDGLAATA